MRPDVLGPDPVYAALYPPTPEPCRLVRGPLRWYRPARGGVLRVLAKGEISVIFQ